MNRDLRELCNSSSSELTPSAIDYLCSIQPANYANIIGSNLDADSLGKMISAIAESDSRLSLEEQAGRLLALSKLPRFDVAWMMADDSVQASASKLIGELPDGDQCKTLSKIFV